MEQRILVVGLLCCAATCAPRALAQSPLLLVTSDFRPYVWCEKDSATGLEVARRGIDIDVVSELFRRIEQPYTVQCLPWRRALAMVMAGEAAAVFPGFSTPERQAFALFLDAPIHVSQYSLFVARGGEFPFETAEDLAGKRVGIERGHDVSPEFDAGARAGRFVVEEASSPEQNLKKLLAGRIDVYINNHQVVLHTARELDLLHQIAALPVPITRANPSYLMISRSAPLADRARLVRRLNQALRQMWKDGTIERLTPREERRP